MIFQNEFKIKIIYKSGAVHEFWTSKFETETGADGITSAVWKTVGTKNKPIVLGVNDIASVWQVGTRRRLRW